MFLKLLTTLIEVPTIFVLSKNKENFFNLKIVIFYSYENDSTFFAATKMTVQVYPIITLSLASIEKDHVISENMLQ